MDENEKLLQQARQEIARQNYSMAIHLLRDSTGDLQTIALLAIARELNAIAEQMPYNPPGVV